MKNANLKNPIFFNFNLLILNSRKGFTLLELMIVLFLVTLILSIASVFFVNTLPSTRLNAAVREMSATIRYAKTLAQINGEQKAIIIDLDSKSYGIEGRDFKSISRDLNIKVIDPFSGEINTGKYQITFYAGGGIGVGTIVLWNNKRAVSIQLDPVIGAVVIK